MRILKTVEGLTCFLAQRRHPLDSRPENYPDVGLVPTMGALHSGHLSLVRRARSENDVVLVSIFVNPLQFSPGEDLDRYPRTLAEDIRLCSTAGVDAIFAPTPTVLYGTATPNYEHLTAVIPPRTMTSVLCGKFRPGHFEGVATVVLKLLNLVKPTRAYFGRKDAQQLAILKRLTKDLNLSVKIVGCPIIRDKDGLALSSRNQYLTPEDRRQALGLSKALGAAEELFQRGEHRCQELLSTTRRHLEDYQALRVEYVDLVHPESMEPLDIVESKGLLAVAAYVGSTRLIDNVLLRSRQPIIAIDGPAGAGKSTVARRVASQLGLLYLDTGAMYRAVTWLALQRDIDLQDEVAVAELMPDCDIRLCAGDHNSGISQPTQVWVNDQEVTQAIRSQAVTSHVSTIAAQPLVRQTLLDQQQQYGVQGGVVMEGRDIGTHVFPDAELKIFLTASVAERARRRQRDLQEQNQPLMELEALERAIDERDRKDSTRRVAPLRKANDAIELQTDGLTIDEVVAKIVALFQENLTDQHRFEAN